MKYSSKNSRTRNPVRCNNEDSYVYSGRIKSIDHEKFHAQHQSFKLFGNPDNGTQIGQLVASEIGKSPPSFSGSKAGRFVSCISELATSLCPTLSPGLVSEIDMNYTLKTNAVCPAIVSHIELDDNPSVSGQASEQEIERDHKRKEI